MAAKLVGREASTHACQPQSNSRGFSAQDAEATLSLTTNSGEQKTKLHSVESSADWKAVGCLIPGLGHRYIGRRLVDG